jgi:hypothetical protein
MVTCGWGYGKLVEIFTGGGIVGEFAGRTSVEHKWLCALMEQRIMREVRPCQDARLLHRCPRGGGRSVASHPRRGPLRDVLPVRQANRAQVIRIGDELDYTSGKVAHP